MRSDVITCSLECLNYSKHMRKFWSFYVYYSVSNHKQSMLLSWGDTVHPINIRLRHSDTFFAAQITALFPCKTSNTESMHRKLMSSLLPLSRIHIVNQSGLPQLVIPSQKLDIWHTDFTAYE